MFLATALVIPASLLVFLPINTTVGLITAVGLYAACVVVLIVASPVVEVTTEFFSAGKARLPIGFAGEATAYRDEEATLERGQRLDARAWLMLRGWVRPVMKIEITDPDDPTPYWLVSTRRPERVVEALSDARSRV
ncbi:MAG: Membrane protein [Microbacteriaceae bacterium]|nr:Membrane protein [Microbacteriaceae bacterium]